MKTVNVLCLTGAIFLLSQLSLTVKYSSGSVGDEENVFQNEQPYENEQELMTEEEDVMSEEEAVMSDEVPYGSEDQMGEPEGELMVDEEAGPFDENLQEEPEQDLPQQWDAPAAE